MADDDKAWYEQLWDNYMLSLEQQQAQDQMVAQAGADVIQAGIDFVTEAYDRNQAIQQQNQELNMEITAIQNDYLGISPDIVRASLPDGSKLMIKPTLIDNVCRFISEDLSEDLKGRMDELTALRDEKLAWAAEDPAVDADFDISTAQSEYTRISETAGEMVADIRKIEAAINDYNVNGGGVDLLLGYQAQYAGDAKTYKAYPHTPWTAPEVIPEEPLGGNPPGYDPDEPDYYPPVLEDDGKDEEEPVVQDPAIDGTSPVVVPTTPTSPIDVSPIIESTGAEEVANPTFAAKMATALGVEDIDGDGALSDDEITEIFSTFGTSGASSLIVPSGLKNGSVNVKSASTVGAVGVTLAAAAALGGKIYYDKKNTDEDDDEMDDVVSEMIEVKANATGADIGTGMMSGLNMVELKEQLLRVGEESEA